MPAEIRLWVGITDDRWFRFLRQQPGPEEINFWQPSGRQRFGALPPGGPFLFKLHSPSNFIVGGGFFSHSSLLPCSLAWEAFGTGNGAESLSEMRRLIARYRGARAAADEDFLIGCILLQAPFFFSEEEWIEAPQDWAPNLVKGRTYSTASSEGLRLWAQVQERLNARADRAAFEVLEEPDVYGDPTTIVPRIGQGTFRVLITDNYQRRCAITGEKALPVLEAAHILPVSEGGRHRPDNGILLRSDLHRLFDRGYLTVSPSLQVHISSRLRSEFGNGEIYYPLAGTKVWIPRQPDQRPSLEHLEWHADTVFRP